MLAELYSWWLRQMAGLAARLLRRAGPAAPDALLLAPLPQTAAGSEAAGAVELLRRRRGVVARLGRFDLSHDAGRLSDALAGRRRGEQLLLVPPAPLLAREVALPLAAAQGAETVLGYEMDRLTPFQAAEVFWNWRPLARDRAQGVLRLELAVLPRAAVTEWLGRLRALGATPEALEAPASDDSGAPWRIALDHNDPAYAARARLVQRGLAGACAVLALALAVVPLVRQSLALDDAERRAAALRPAMAEVDALRRRITGDAAASPVAAAQARAGETLSVLALLTDLLGDDTWLSTLTLHDRKLSMEGQAPAATKLIAALSSEPRVRNPAFAAPVVRSDVHTDIFSIQAELAP